tara:strand:+ start:1272 stop:4550 length:3279 start_codon:yes stop_codon:yes gene_type:complete
MPTKVVVTSQKLFDSLNNDVDFSSNTSSFAASLKGNVLEKFRFEFIVQVGAYFKLEDWSFQAYGSNKNEPVVDDPVRIEMDGADFSNSIKVGDTILLKGYGGGNGKNTGGELKVEAIEPGAIDAKVIVASSNGFPNTNDSSNFHYNDDWIANITPITALEFKFGLIENSEPTTYVSKVTGEEMKYRFQDIPTVSGQSAVTGTLSGVNKAGDSGQITCEFIDFVADNNLDDTQDTWMEYKIKHDFVGFPFFLDGQEESLEGGNSPEDDYAGDKSLKYVFEAAFMRTITDVNTKRIGSFDTSDGSFGYKDESFNGFPSPYSIQNVTYFNVDTGKTVGQLDVGSTVRVNCSVIDSSNSFVTGDAIQVTHTSITDSTQYTFNRTENYEEIHSLERLRSTIDAGTVSDNLIKNFTATLIGSGQTNIEFDLDLTNPTQVAKLVEGQGYQLLINCQKGNNTNTGNRVQVGLDYNFYTKNSDIDGLFDLLRNEQFDHANTWVNSGTSTGTTNAKVDVEEAIMTFSEFSLNLAEEAVLTGLSLNIVTYNTVTEEFGILETIPISLGDQFLVDDVQQISLDSTRGFKLKDDNQFNLLQLRTTTGVVGVSQNYETNVGWRMPWQKWLEYFDADPVFYDATEPQKGLNRFAAQYSKDSNPTAPNGNPNDYVLRTLLLADVEKDGITTTYRGWSENMGVWGYDEDDQGDPPSYTCAITTHNEQGDQIASNEGNVVFDSDFTEVRATINPETDPIFSTSIDFSLVATTWNRSAFGNELLAPATLSPRVGDWLLETANDTDTFADTLGNPHTKGEVGLYSSDPTSISTLQNCNAFYGCFSLDKYESYTASGKMFSDASDNDGLLYQICYLVDAMGNEYTLSFAATTGGIGLDLNTGQGSGPAFELGNNQTSVFAFTNDVANVALVYNFGKRDCKQLAVFNTTKSGFDWDVVGDLDFKVVRSGADITAELVNWTIDGSSFSNTFNFNLNDDPLTEKFLGFNNIGFGFMSQDQGGFKDVTIEVASFDYWGEIKMTPEESSDSKQIITINSEFEQDSSNELVQLNGDLILCSIDWVSPNFLLRCKVNPNTFDAGKKYNITAEIGEKDNIA